MNNSQPAVVAQTKGGNGHMHLSWVGCITCKGSSMLWEWEFLHDYIATFMLWLRTNG